MSGEKKTRKRPPKREIRVQDLVTPLKPHDSRDRLTMVLKLYHQQSNPNSAVIPCETSAWKYLDVKEETFSRGFDVGEEAQPLISERVAKWIDPSQIGYLVVDNTESRGLTTVPTPEEREAISARIIELSTGGEPLLVLPGFAQQLLVADPAKVTIRCQSGTAHYRLYVFPR